MLTEIPPITIRAVSFTSAALILAVIVTLLKQPLRLRRSEAIPVATVGIFLICGFNVLTSFGQVLIETSKAAIIAYTMPSLTALLAAVYLRERVGMRLVLALTIAMIGLGILASENVPSLIEQPIGPAIMMLAALSWATGTVGLKSQSWRLPPLPLTVWFFAFSSLAVWPLVLLVEPPWEQEWPIPQLGSRSQNLHELRTLKLIYKNLEVQHTYLLTQFLFYFLETLTCQQN